MLVLLQPKFQTAFQFKLLFKLCSGVDVIAGDGCLSSLQNSGGVASLKRVSSTDQVYEVLYQQVLSLALPPDTKLSEAEVAKQLGVSRQPVRDAFFRLSNLGFLLIQPQKATRVTKIRVQDIHKARFVRTSVEIEVMRRAVEIFEAEDFAALEANLKEQKQAVDQGDREWFHKLDNAFHQLICQRAGVGLVWDLIMESKAHTDRVRFLSLASGSMRAWEDHVQIVKMLKSGDVDAAVTAMRDHLSSIQVIIDQLREENHSWFLDEASSLLDVYQ